MIDYDTILELIFTGGMIGLSIMLFIALAVILVRIAIFPCGC